MAFTVAGLDQELKLDNPRYERVLRSDLHSLVELLGRAHPPFTAQAVAAEMKKISSTKWAKYARTRRYLEREIPGLTALLRAIPTDFATVLMSSQTSDTILRHVFKWTSDTGNLNDLARVYTRESVSWPQWPDALTACIGRPHGDAYLRPGQHTGLAAANPASSGTGTDDHALLGPFNQSILNYNGAPASAPMDQVYQYSYDQVNWLPIPNSSYTIVRKVSSVAGGRVQLEITKTNTSKPGDTFTVRKIF